jgi:hypothetical protein
MPDSLPIGRMLALCGELIESAARDLETWQARADVNWSAAGRSALTDLETVIGYLEKVRAEIVPALVMDDARNRAREVDLPDPGHRVPGNSGPGY